LGVLCYLFLKICVDYSEEFLIMNLAMLHYFIIIYVGVQAQKRKLLSVKEHVEHLTSVRDDINEHKVSFFLMKIFIFLFIFL
jgi:hypothetical protein